MVEKKEMMQCVAELSLASRESRLVSYKHFYASYGGPSSCLQKHKQTVLLTNK